MEGGGGGLKREKDGRHVFLVAKSNFVDCQKKKQGRLASFCRDDCYTAGSIMTN